MRFLHLPLVAALAFIAVSAGTAQATPQPKLIVAISVDQFASSVYARYLGSYSGGLKRLSGGIVFPVAYQSHAATETCPGHSTILTGDHPSHTGIIANSWFDRRARKTLYCVAVPGETDPTARGPQNLKVTTLGDWLKQAYPASRVVSISGKDRAAIMMGGHRPDLVSWWSDALATSSTPAGFNTSEAAGATSPETGSILKAENERIAKAWRTPPQLWPAATPANCEPLQRPVHFGDIDISGHVPPDAAVAATAGSDFAVHAGFQEALRASPLFDSLVLDFAAHVAEQWKLGHGPAPDLLAVGLSATDYVGHRYGNGGPEMCAQVHALDSSLTTFFDRLDQLNVAYIVVLTADHGSVDAPERLRQEGESAIRVDTAKFLARLNGHLKRRLGVAWDPIVGGDVQQLYIAPRASPADRTNTQRYALAWLKRQSSVAFTFTRDAISTAVPAKGKSPSDLTISERLNESFDAERSGDIFVVFKPLTTLGWPHKANDSVAGHGSPWDYDRQIPILFWWKGAPSITSSTPVETVDIAPTLAAFIGLRHPSVDGRCLVAVAACPAGDKASDSGRGR